jgi:uncharacterized protein (TIGR01777 family)
MKILMTGSTGLLGKTLTAMLQEKGHEVAPLRRPGGWDPEKGFIDAAAVEGLDGVIHLAGEPIAGIRWTRDKKRRIRDSRVEGTTLLAGALEKAVKPPRWMVCASAVGFYGDRGDEVLREDSGPGKGFLADVCRAWEASAAPAVRRGIRTVHVRLGIVLSRHGGALPQMLIPFKMGMGGRVGSGRQYLPWISLDDVAGAVGHVIDRELSGPFNLAAPGIVTNAGFAEALGRALHRPAVTPLPAFAARLALGEMADELLLASQRVEPAALTASGYRFKTPDLPAALESVLR